MARGLYIHIPFCARKCEYCDFVSFSGCEDKVDDYIAAVAAEADGYADSEIDTIFIGGGTPSLLREEQIERLCAIVRDRFKLAEGYEWTIEANPGTLTEGKLKAMLSGGINRISIGVQAFNDTELRAVGRIHNAESAEYAVMLAHSCGFKNISIDLMESLPYQTAESFKRTLECAAALPISHISVYSLIIEEGTPIKEKYDSGIYAVPDEAEDRALYHYTAKFLSEHGFNRYEISNYAKPGYESRHNLKYWDCEEYIGLGIAAASYLNGRRYTNTAGLDEYIGGDCRLKFEEKPDNEELMGEFMMLGLRKTAGVSKADFSKRFGCDIESVYGDILDRFVNIGVMDTDGECYFLSERGLDVANSVMCEFL